MTTVPHSAAQDVLPALGTERLTPARLAMPVLVAGLVLSAMLYAVAVIAVVVLAVSRLSS